MKVRLNELTAGKMARIVNILGSSKTKARLTELGFIKGEIIKIQNITPLGNSYLIDCRDSLFALRLNAVNLIEVEEIAVSAQLV